MSNKAVIFMIFISGSVMIPCTQADILDFARDWSQRTEENKPPVQGQQQLLSKQQNTIKQQSTGKQQNTGKQLVLDKQQKKLIPHQKQKKIFYCLRLMFLPEMSLYRSCPNQKYLIHISWVNGCIYYGNSYLLVRQKLSYENAIRVYWMRYVN